MQRSLKLTRSQSRNHGEFTSMTLQIGMTELEPRFNSNANMCGTFLHLVCWMIRMRSVTTSHQIVWMRTLTMRKQAWCIEQTGELFTDYESFLQRYA